MMILTNSARFFRTAAPLALCAGFSAFTAQPVRAQTWEMTINADKPGATIAPNFYGLMTEEINHAYDGGLYAELIRNRSFLDNDTLPVGWAAVGDKSNNNTVTLSLDKTSGVSDGLPVSLKIDADIKSGGAGAANEGFWGMAVRPQTNYKVSFYAKSTNPGPLTVRLESADGKTVWAQASISGLSPEWKKVTGTLTTKTNISPSQKNRLVIATEKSGLLWLSQVSLFPPTYHNRPNGNREDLMEKMAELRPAFLRFPGGNYVDPGQYHWKDTIGPLKDRTFGQGAWGYRVSNGLGLLEFLLWCEDLRMEPILAVTDGRTGGKTQNLTNINELAQDAVDEIEYVTGDANTVWGAKRAKDGHPKPFALRYVEIGNEDFFDTQENYNLRFAKIYDAIRAKYPALQIIATRRDVTSRKPDIIDDHIYASVDGMLRASHNYDNYDRSKPPIFVGEWATTVGSPTPILQAALSDAAYLTGLERNADVVKLTCYAPLLVNVNMGARQWGTNLIGYDALSSFGSPSYYMQAMFAQNKGDFVIPFTLRQTGNAPVSASARGAVGVGTWNTQAEFTGAEVALTGGTQTKTVFSAAEPNWKREGGEWAVQNGILVQTGNQTPTLAYIGDPNASDYTFRVRARKTSGAEGFLIYFHVKDSRNLVFWNLGGWANTRSAFQQINDGQKNEFGTTQTIIETGRWYDIRVEVKNGKIRGYLDDKLISEADEPGPPPPLYASITRDTKTSDIICKVVNAGYTAQTVQMTINGASAIVKTATGHVLTGNPNGINSVEEPKNIVPRPLVLENAGKTFTHEFPANSVSVFRLKTK